MRYRHPSFEEAMRALKREPRMAPLVQRFGRPDLTRYHSNSRGLFPALLRSIVYQQISGKAAAAILLRVHALFDGAPSPEKLLALRLPQLRKAGLSVQKIRYVRDLARKCLDKTVDERHFRSMTSEEVIAHLVQVDGVGVWTAQMLLIFTLYREDILPTGDLAIQKGFKDAYGLRTLPTKKKMEQLARPWRNHATAGSWYLWRLADEAKRKPATAQRTKSLRPRRARRS